MVIQKLTKEQVYFLNSLSNQIYDGENNYYYLPFWFKELGDGDFEIIRFEKLPKSVIDIIFSQRESNENE